MRHDTCHSHLAVHLHARYAHGQALHQCRPLLPCRSSASDFVPFIPGFLHWVHVCNNGAAAAAAGEFLHLTVAGKTVGYLKAE